MAIRKNHLMYKQFGICGEHICGECSNLVSFTYRDKRYKKCKVYGITQSEASDWANKYTACGMFNKEYGARPIIELVKREAVKPEIEILDGQMHMTDLED